MTKIPGGQPQSYSGEPCTEREANNRSDNATSSTQAGILWQHTERNQPPRLESQSESPIPNLTMPTPALEQLQKQIATRIQVANSPGSPQTVHSLCSLLRQRFAETGSSDDIRDYYLLQNSIPPIDLRNFPPVITSFRQELHQHEHQWVQWQPWLLSVGYRLYPRYAPDWTPSWRTSGRRVGLSHDQYGTLIPSVIAAIRVSDNQPVWMKLCPEDDSQDEELKSYIFFSTQPRRSDPRNHCCPLLDIIRTPLVKGKKHSLIIMPMLRDIVSPRPQVVQDLVDCVLGFAEGLAFMHEHNFAHRDIHQVNMGMDASRLLPGGWHPYAKLFTYPHTPGATIQELPRTLRRTGVELRYHFFDFGLSIRFPNSNPTQRRIIGMGGRNMRAPEMSRTIPYDPFPVDVLMLGDVFVELDQTFGCLGFLRPVIDRMTDDNLGRRPTAAQCLAELQSCVQNRPPSLLRAKIPTRKSTPISTMLKSLFCIRV